MSDVTASDSVVSTDADATDENQPTTSVDGETTTEGAANDSGTAKPDNEAEGKKFTQADVDRILGERLARNKADAEKDKSDAQAWREYQDSQKDDDTRRREAEEKRDADFKALADENAALKLDKLRGEIAGEKKLPPKMVKFLTGSTREELEATADELLEALPAAVAGNSSKPTPVDRESKKLGDDDAPFDPKSIVANIPRG